MGNKLKNSALFQKNAMSQIGTTSTCPNCQQQFPPSITYQTFEQHVMQCLDAYKPSEQERLRMQRRKKSKDSIGSSNGSEDNDYITVQIYTKRKKADTKSSQQIWQKTKLTYSESLLTSLAAQSLRTQTSAYKLLWLHHKLTSLHRSWKQGSESITFHPVTIVQDSIKLLEIDLWNQLKLAVIGDVVHDAGGLLRQWATMLIGGLVDLQIIIINKWGYYSINQKVSKSRISQCPQLPKRQKQKNEKNVTVQFMKQFHQYQKINYYRLFQLLGCVLAKIIIQKVTIPYCFDSVFLAALLKLPAGLQLLYNYDREIYNSVKYLTELCQRLKKDPQNSQFMEQLQCLCLTFTTPQSPPTQLTPKGSSIQIRTADQLQSYLSLYIEYICSSTVPYPLLHNFHQSLHQTKMTTFLTLQELEILFNGVQGQAINVADWKAGTQYRQPLTQDHKVVTYFWNTVHKMGHKDRSRLLKFVTGAQRLPVFGFKQLQTNRGQTSCFVIEATKYDKKTNCFPKAHTCFNRLILPLYPSEQILSQHLLGAIRGNFDGVWGME